MKPFMILSHGESMKKILGALLNLPANQQSQSSPFDSIMAELTVLICWQIQMRSQDFLHTFSMALYHKWGVKNGLSFVLQFYCLFLKVQVVCLQNNLFSQRNLPLAENGHDNYCDVDYMY